MYVLTTTLRGDNTIPNVLYYLDWEVALGSHLYPNVGLPEGSGPGGSRPGLPGTGYPAIVEREYVYGG